MPKYSQVFLKSEKAGREIAAACLRNKSDFTAEIGPGKGFLTQFLLPQLGDKLTLIEIDPLMVAEIKTRFPQTPKIINVDFLEVNLEKIFPHGRVQFVGNLPYAVGAPILQKILSFPRCAGAVLMFQKEVADRITAAGGDGKYGVLSLSVQCKGKARRILTVKKTLFSPIPKVDSAVVEIIPFEKPIFRSQAEEDNFFRTVKASFSQRRKTILNSLSAGLGLEKTAATTALEYCGISPQARAETVKLEEFVRLSNRLFS